MTVVAFTGHAGTGKTHELIESLRQRLLVDPLNEHQRVLALTYMHGSRRRLDARLADLVELNSRYLACTLDSFGWKLVNRWAQLAERLGYDDVSRLDYDAVCEVAAALTQIWFVRHWISMSYPIVLLDEGQDLNGARSSLIEALADGCDVLLAYDEFQCLSRSGTRGVPVENWVGRYVSPTVLTENKRAENSELVEGAQRIRSGQTLDARGPLKTFVTQTPKRAATYLANAIAWRKQGSLAVLTPSRKRGFADKTIELVNTKPHGQQKNGPYKVPWEESESVEKDSFLEALDLDECVQGEDLIDKLDQAAGETLSRPLKQLVRRQIALTGMSELSLAEVYALTDRVLGGRRRYATRVDTQLQAMTIHQAKNREFDHVVVLWPYVIPAKSDARRRLLYNAITRARMSCTILIQSENLSKESPFIGDIDTSSASIADVLGTIHSWAAQMGTSAIVCTRCGYSKRPGQPTLKTCNGQDANALVRSRSWSQSEKLLIQEWFGTDFV